MLPDLHTDLIVSCAGVLPASWTQVEGGEQSLTLCLPSD